MKKVSDLKPGDEVLLINIRDSEIVTREVVTVGRKYITIKEPKDHNRYDKETLICPDWTSWQIFPGTIEDYNIMLKEEKKKSDLCHKISKMMQEASLEQLNEIYNILKLKESYDTEYTGQD